MRDRTEAALIALLIVLTAAWVGMMVWGWVR
jgi:hypothetical protein